MATPAGVRPAKQQLQTASEHRAGLLSPSKELFTEQSLARRIVGPPESSERYVAVAPFGCDLGGLGLSLESLAHVAASHAMVRDDRGVGLPSVAGVNATRVMNGLRWEEGQIARLAIGLDGSVALRVRLSNDRNGIGGITRRANVGLYTSLELLHNAIELGRHLQRSAVGSHQPSQWTFRMQFLDIQGRSLVCDPPSPVAGQAEWPITTPYAEPHLELAGHFAFDSTADEVGKLLDAVAVLIASHFGAESRVRALRPGATVASSQPRIVRRDD